MSQHKHCQAQLAESSPGLEIS